MVLLLASCNLNNSTKYNQNNSHDAYKELLHNDTDSVNFHLSRKMIYDEKLYEYLTYLSEREKISDSFFIDINKILNIKPKTLTMWWLFNEDYFSDAVFLTFLKMFNSEKKGLYGNDIENRTNENEYLLIMSLHYYIKSGNKPNDMLLLGEIVDWVIYNYDYKRNKDLEQEVLLIKKRFDL